MTPKEKAKELTDKYFNVGDQEFDYSKEFALIAVDELIDFENRMIDEWTRYFEGKGGQMKVERLYWEEVKAEIKKL